MAVSAESFDHVIVGAGSAGCVLAARLSEDPDCRVLLLEAGPPDRGYDWRLHMPAALSYPMNGTTYNWDFHTTPQPGMGGRRLHCPRGRVLGGSSSINGMVFVRGNPGDFDHWAEAAGAPHWSFAHCLPYFRRMETAGRGADDWRGGDGPLHITTGPAENPLYGAWLEAGQQAGHPFTEDYNGRQQEGVCRFDMTVKNGRRWSTARAYLHPVMDRPNLVVRTGALTRRLLVEGGRAVGVAYRRGGTEHEARAEREVLLAAGAIGSPQLLQLSGIGPGDVLKRAGVTVIHDLPGVGENLQDHLEIYMQVACTRPVTLYSSLNPVGKAAIGLRWLLTHTGPGATNHFEAGGFLRSGPEVPYPDVQYHFLPLAANYDGSNAVAGHGFQTHVGPMRSASRGHVRIRSDDPAAEPEIDFRYLSRESDRQEWRRCIRMTREIYAQAAFASWRGAEISPGPEVTSDQDIDAFVAAKAESAYHPSGTCRMGAEDGAVVDGALKVHGVDGLRVIDASIMPRIPNGNLNGPTIMLAEKGADLVRGQVLEPSTLVPYRAPVSAAAE
ncbi:MAG: choline dehydrogenase [Azospirillaceae bacterium]